MSKIKATSELIAKARKVFSQTKAILAGNAFTRQELKALERKKVIRKIPMYKRSPFVGGGSTLCYVWKLNREAE